MRLTLIALALAGLYLAGLGCGGTANCISLCQEAQAGKCTSIKGDCSAFCNALDSVAGPANCSSQRDAYQNCLNSSSPVCSAGCGVQEGALSTCVAPYCLIHAAEQACKTLIASFM